MGRMPERKAPGVYGRYETLFRIASGGMAEVYAARSRGEAGFQKLVALKRMLHHLTDDERFVTMFMDEGRLAANITSPHVVSTMDLGRADDGSLYLVMELVVGTTLSTLLRNAARAGGGIPIDIGVELLAQAAQGLHDAHEARTPFGAPLHIVHRDISPQNILVGTDGRARITDFGVARAIMRRTKTSTGEFKGKLSYFSPEQCADRNLDRRSDIFSLGVVAWETLTTRRLFHAENPLAVLERVTRMPIPAANVVN
ncbi:MAG: serine/threonine protein kinase, partial [Sandaracinaceae bacterium]|nr:serine/threonine protein kinase [Sandaracinaceae bacterium]